MSDAEKGRHGHGHHGHGHGHGHGHHGHGHGHERGHAEGHAGTGDRQTFYPEDLAEMVAWVRAHGPPGTRVLEVGCGDGEVVRRLREAGLDALGVDPGGEASDCVRAIALEDLDEPPFDVVFASVSLHHVADPARAAAALRRLIRPGAVALVREFDRVRLDHEPTLRWWFHQRLALTAAGVREPDDDLGDFDAFLAGWRAKMAEHVHPWSVVAGLLADAGFVTDSVTEGPYLFRWGLHQQVRPLEEALIASGHLRAVGIRWTGRS